MTAVNTAGIASTKRTGSYVMTVRMENGKVAPEDAVVLDAVKTAVRASNFNRKREIDAKRKEIQGWCKTYHSAYKVRRPIEYVKLQGRLGKDNPVAATKYRNAAGKSTWYTHRLISLKDAQFADVYVYTR